MITIQKDSVGTVLTVVGFCAIIMAMTLYLTRNLWIIIPIFAVLLFCTWFIVFFFRVPVRERPEGEGLVTSIADGKVVIIEKVFEKEYLKKECIMVSVYMNFFDVHTNFWPFDGKTTYSKYHPGRYHLAFLPKSSDLNEHHSVAVLYTDANGVPHPSGEILFKQIAGTFARRIVWYSELGSEEERGRQCGILKFGSRFDLFLPLDAEVKVHLGQEIKAAETVVAELK